MQERIGGAVIAGERMTRLQGETTDGWTESDADRGERGTCQDHLIVLVFKWLRCPDCRGAEGAAPRETMNSLKGWSERERERERETGEESCRNAAAADATRRPRRRSRSRPPSLLLLFGEGKKELTRSSCPWGPRKGGNGGERAGRINEPGSYKMQAYRIVCQNGAAPAAFAPSDGRGCISSASSRVRR